MVLFDLFLTSYMYFVYQGGKKLERARDLFEQVLEGCPAKFAKSKLDFLMKIRGWLIFFFSVLQRVFTFSKAHELRLHFFLSGFYLMYAKLEEEHGLARHAMTIYERATKAVLLEEQFEVRLWHTFVTTLCNYIKYYEPIRGKSQTIWDLLALVFPC